MKVYIEVREDSVIDGWSSAPFSENSIEVEVADNNPFLSEPPRFYKYIDGKIAKDEKLVQTAKEIKKKEKEERNKFKGKEFKNLSTPEKDALLELIAKKLGFL